MATAAAATSAEQQQPGVFSWLSPRVSFSHDFSDSDDPTIQPQNVAVGSATTTSDVAIPDFEFSVGATSILDADELFSDGKLIPFHLPSRLPPPPDSESDPPSKPEPVSPLADPTPAPISTTHLQRWRDLLKLRKLQLARNSNSNSNPNPNPNPNPNTKPLRRLLKRNPKPEPSLSIPLLENSSDNNPKIPEKSPDPDSNVNPLPPRVRLKTRNQPVPAAPVTPETEPVPAVSVTADSPRLNAAGKVVFNGLGRSSSSPSSLSGGGPRVSARHSRGIERSYSAHTATVRVAPVLNVPVCSLRGSRKSVSVFGIDRLFGRQKSGLGGGGSKSKVQVKKDQMS